MCTYTISEIAERVKPVAEQYDIEKVTLFGSYARGEATEESDIDLMISYKKILGAFALSGIFSDFKEALSKSVDIISEKAVTSYYATDLGKKLYSNIKNEGILIYDRNNQG